MIVQLPAQLEIEAQSQVCSHYTFYIKSFDTATSTTFWISCWFLFQESYLQLFGQWSTNLNLAQVRSMDNQFGMEGVSFHDPFQQEALHYSN